jgi:hypothetical protein
MLFPRIGSLSLEQIRGYLVDLNPDPGVFIKQSNTATPVARAFTTERSLPLYGIPTLADLFAFVAAYGGRLGRQVKKTDLQRRQANQVRFNLELKRVPFFGTASGATNTGGGPATRELENRILDTARAAGVLDRIVIQSFDHRVLRSIRELHPDIRTAVLIANTAPVAPAGLALDAGAQVYSPEFTFLDEPQVRQLHDARIAVVPFTVNDSIDMSRLLSWGVDGMITDYPDRLIPLLKAHHLRFV